MAKKGIFNDPIAPKERKASKPFVSPTYDQQKLMYPGGDYYGTGFKAKMGHMRGNSPGDSVFPMKPSRTKPPHSLA